MHATGEPGEEGWRTKTQWGRGSINVHDKNNNHFFIADHCKFYA